MSYNNEIIHEQGGSVLRIASGGSLIVDSGGTIAPTGTIAATDQTVAGSLTISAGAVLDFAGIARFHVAASAAAPSGLPYSGSPGDVFLRVDGANSAGYVNTSSGAAGSVWTIFSEL